MTADIKTFLNGSEVFDIACKYAKQTREGWVFENGRVLIDFLSVIERAVLAASDERKAGLREAVSIIKGIDDGEAPEYMACIEAIQAAIAASKSSEGAKP